MCFRTQCGIAFADRLSTAVSFRPLSRPPISAWKQSLPRRAHSFRWGPVAPVLCTVDVIDPEILNFMASRRASYSSPALWRTCVKCQLYNRLPQVTMLFNHRILTVWSFIPWFQPRPTIPVSGLGSTCYRKFIISQATNYHLSNLHWLDGHQWPVRKLPLFVFCQETSQLDDWHSCNFQG